MVPQSEESAGLLPVSNCPAIETIRPRRCCTLAACVKSKAARLTLIWNLSVLLIYTILKDATLLIEVDNSSPIPIVAPIMLSLNAVFSPVAGLLTDIRFSRYKAAQCSSYVILLEVSVIVISVVILTPTIGKVFLWNNNTVAWLLGGIGIAMILFTSVIFVINALQFGMDQLHDSSTEDFILFIHWYVWIYYASTALTQTASNLAFYDSVYLDYYDVKRILGIIMASVIAILIILLLVVSLCTVQHRKRWFHIEPAGVNPYKLVYRVVKFAYQHKVPLRRSAFTYCDEDEFPSRMDLGKHKYGGPFTTKQVEDVKAFWGILKVLVCIGPAFMLQTVSVSILPMFAKHGHLYFEYSDNHTHEIRLEGAARYIFFSYGELSPFLVVLCIPFYLCLIRPYFSYHIPGMLKRMGLGMVLIIISIAAALAMDMIIHNDVTNTNCMFANNFIHDIFNQTAQLLPLYKNLFFLGSQHLLSALFNMLLDIAILEFICSQSPYCMKGLLLGAFFSMKNLSPALVIISIIPFAQFWNSEFVSCGSGFYLMNIGIGVLDMALFTVMARRYKYRTVNEPSNEYRYAEEYYSNIQ